MFLPRCIPNSLILFSLPASCSRLIDRFISYRPGWVTRYLDMLAVFSSSLNEGRRWRESDAGIAGSFEDWFPVFFSFVVLVLVGLVPCIGRLSMMYPIQSHPNLKNENNLDGPNCVLPLVFCISYFVFRISYSVFRIRRRQLDPRHPGSRPAPRTHDVRLPGKAELDHLQGRILVISPSPSF